MIATPLQNALNPKQAADYLGLSVATLATWRSTGKVLLPFFKLGDAVRYRKADLDAYIAQAMQNAPSDATGRMAAELATLAR